MRNQDHEIHRPNYSLARETRGACLVMVNQIRDEKENRDQKGSAHTSSMRLDVALTNEIKAHKKQEGAGGVQAGVEGRKKSHLSEAPFGFFTKDRYR